MRRIGVLLLWLGGLGGACAGIPDAPLFRRVGVEQGLPSNYVYRIAQDRAGYLWLATGDGLARYDGVRFETWQHDPGDPASLPSNTVQTLHIDAADRIWVGTEGGGLSRLDPDRRGFRHFRAERDPRFALEDVWSIASDAAGALWFGGYGGGVYRFDPERDALEVFRHAAQDPRSLAADHVLAIAADARGRVWIGTSAGLQQRVADGFETVAGLSAPLVFSLSPEPDGSLWIGTGAGLDRRLPDGAVQAAQFTPALANPRVSAVLLDRHGTRWLATHGGVHHHAGGRLVRYPGLAARGGHAGAQLIFDALEDHEGGLWFATLGDGLLRLPPNWRNFAVLLRDSAERGGLSSAAPVAAAEARAGGYWVVGPGGVLDHVDARGTVTRHLHETPKLPESGLWSVLEAGDGSVWVGQQNGLSRYDRRANSLRSWGRGDATDAVPAGHVDLLREDAHGRLWLAANGAGVQQRAPDGRVLATWTPGAAGGFADGDIDALELDPDGQPWLACGEGLYRFDPLAARFVAVPGSPRERVFGFDFEPGGTLWLARLGALERYRIGESLQRLERVDRAHGLPAVQAGGVRVDADGQVWMTSTRGLFRYRPARQDLRQFGVRDGLPTPEFGNRPPLRTGSGVIAAGSADGLVLFDPRRVEESRSTPRLRLERIEVLRDGQAKSLDPATALALRHDDRELRIAARLLSFADPQSHRYRFRLRGYESDWIDAGAGGERVFSRLPAGRFQLEAVAANAAGIWTAPPLRLQIDVTPPWWSTWWARAGMALLGALLLALVAAAYRIRLRRRLAAQLAQRQHEWTLRASEAKSTFLATLGHEIRTPMTGVLGMTELLLRQPLPGRERGQVESIQRSGQLLLRLVNDALDLARIEAGRLELAEQALDPRALLHQVAAQLQPLAEARGLALRLRLDHAAPAWVRGDAQRLQQILLNLGHNALKFTEHGEIELGLGPGGADDAAGIEFRVRDTGPGLNAEQQARLFQRFSQADGALTARRYGGSGLGLAICQELTAAMGGRIALESTPGVGTCFRVQLPLPACDAPAPDIAAEPPAATDPGAGARRVLLVEDDATVAEVVSGLLGARGHAVVVAPHGLAALAELARERFDLALLDLDLPGVDGLTLARMLRAQGHALPLLALTARADAQAEPQARAAGMSGFLRKPVTGAQLARAIEAAGAGAAASDADAASQRCEP